MSEEEKKEEKKPKTPAQKFAEQLKELLAKRDEIRALKKSVKGLKRLDKELPKLQQRLDAARVTEAAVTSAAKTAPDKEKAETELKAARAKVDALEKIFHIVNSKLETREAKLADLDIKIHQLRYEAGGISANAATKEFIRLVRMGLISKRNAHEVMPLVRQCGIVIGNIRKRKWARK